MRCQVQLVIIKQLEHSKGQIKSYVTMYEPKSNIVQVNNFQNVPFCHILSENLPDLFLQQHCHVEYLFKFFDKSLNKIDLFILSDCHYSDVIISLLNAFRLKKPKTYL